MLMSHLVCPYRITTHHGASEDVEEFPCCYGRKCPFYTSEGEFVGERCLKAEAEIKGAKEDA